MSLNLQIEMLIQMEREINNRVEERLKTFLGPLDKFLPRIEKQWEDSFTELFNDVGITATVKTDKFSLPYTNEVVIKLHCESYVPGVYERVRVYRPVLKELLAKDVRKIRFYILAETFDGGGKGFAAAFNLGLKYSFRYYIH